MARAYSQDLRDRVIDAALGGMPARRAAAQFEIGIATAIVWGAGRARASRPRHCSSTSTAISRRCSRALQRLIPNLIDQNR